MSTTSLSGDQVLRQVYDPGNQALRTEVTANISGAQEVIINSVDDNIAIRNSNNSNELLINSNGSINANITGVVTANNASVGLTGATAPTSATEMGAVDTNGKLQALQVDPAGKLLVDITGSSTVTGTVNANIEGLNAFQTSQYTVGTSSVQLTVTPLTNRSSMSMKAVCTTNNYIYIGNSSGVTTSTGYILFNGDSLQLDLTPAQAAYAIASAAAQTLYVLEIGS